MIPKLLSKISLVDTRQELRYKFWLITLDSKQQRAQVAYFLRLRFFYGSRIFISKTYYYEVQGCRLIFCQELHRDHLHLSQQVSLQCAAMHSHIDHICISALNIFLRGEIKNSWLEENRDLFCFSSRGSA